MRTEGWLDERYPGPGMPTMIAPEEARYLHWLTRTVWRDAGHVVELGPWLGGSTAALASGVRARTTDPEHRIHSFDDCVWRAFMAERAALPLEPGDSFEPVLRENLAPWADLVEVHRVRLPDEAIADDAEANGRRAVGPERLPGFVWPADRPVEILFVDGAKSWRGMRHLLRALEPALIPGVTLLVCQDYKYWSCYWVPMILALLGECLEPVHDTLGGATVTWRLRSALPAGALDALAPDVHAVGPDPALDGLAAARETLRGAGDRQGELDVSLAEVAFRAHRGEVDAALAAFRRIEGGWPLGADTLQLERARTYLREVRGRRIPERRALRLARRTRRAAQRARRLLARIG